MVYLPQHFAEPRPEVLADFMRHHAFATVVTNGAAGLIASHLPLLYEPEGGPHGRLLGHLARNNQQAADLADGHEALAIFHGPHAYVSPSWYTVRPSVPTWNYAVVHAYGAAEAIAAEGPLIDLLDRLVTVYEAPRATPWRLADQPETYVKGMARGIVGFAITITRLQGKFKLSQNRNAADRSGVITALADGDAESAAVARLMAAREAGD